MSDDQAASLGRKEALHRIAEVLGPQKPEAGLYLVATPIGNASDLTVRALALLATADVIFCEDTRVTGKLLSLYGLKNRLEPYHEHNAAKVRPKIAARLERGEVVVFVSDAGTPSISDPGYRLTRGMREAGYLVTHAPGPSAALTGLVLSGLPTDRFLFCGFLPPKEQARRRDLEDLTRTEVTLIFYESPKRLAACLKDMSEIFGDREAAIARELTKKFEEIREGTLSDLYRHYDQTGAPKGEVVIVVAGHPGDADVTDEDLEGLLLEAMNEGSLKDAVARVTSETGLPRSHVYDMALRLKRDLAGA